MFDHVGRLDDGDIEVGDISCIRSAQLSAISRDVPCSRPSTASQIACLVPPHFHGLTLCAHHTTIEAFYIAHGTLAFTVDQYTRMVSNGALIVVAMGVEHTFFNPTAAPASMVMWSAAGTCEQLVGELIALVAPTRVWSSPNAP